MSSQIPHGPIPTFTVTKGLQYGLDLQKFSQMQGGGAPDLVAGVGGTKANAVLVQATNTRVKTVTNANDSILLPPGYIGLEVWLYNADAANSMQVFGSNNDTINDVATATGVAQAHGVLAVYRCMQTTGSSSAGTFVAQWYRNLSA